MPVSLDERSSSIPMVVGVHTVVVLSPERTTARSIAQPPTSPDGSLSRLSTLVSLDEPSCSCHTPLVLQSHSRFSWRRTAHPRSRQMSSWRSSERILTCGQALSSRSSTSSDLSTTRLPGTVTSRILISPGRSRRSLKFRIENDVRLYAASS